MSMCNSAVFNFMAIRHSHLRSSAQHSWHWRRFSARAGEKQIRKLNICCIDRDPKQSRKHKVNASASIKHRKIFAFQSTHFCFCFSFHYTHSLRCKHIDHIYAYIWWFQGLLETKATWNGTVNQKLEGSEKKDEKLLFQLHTQRICCDLNILWFFVTSE